MNGKNKESIRPRIKPERAPIPFLLIKPLKIPCVVVLARADDYTMRSRLIANVAPRGGFWLVVSGFWFVVSGLWFLVFGFLVSDWRLAYEPETTNQKPETIKPETDSDGRKAKPG